MTGTSRIARGEFRGVAARSGQVLLGSGAGLICGAVTAKVVAVEGAATGTAALGLAVAAMTLAAMVTDVNVGQGLVARGARAHREGRIDVVAAMVGAARRITGLGAAFIVLLGLALSAVTSAPRGLGSGWLAWSGAAGAFTMLANQEANVLAALGAAGRRARLAALAAATMTTAVASALVAGGTPLIPVGLAIGAVLSFLVHRIATDRLLRALHIEVSSSTHWRSEASALLRFGLPMTGNVLAGYGLISCVPFVVNGFLGTSATAVLRTCTGLSGLVTSLVTAVLTIEYFPRVSAASERELPTVVEQQIRRTVLAVAPMATAIAVLSPWLIRILYAPSLLPAADAMRWWMVGDVMKAASWCVTLAILGHRSPRVLLAAEITGGLVVLALSPLLGHTLGPAGLGVANAVTYAWYLVLVTWLARRRLVGLVTRTSARVVATVVILCIGAATGPAAVSIAASVAAAGLAIASLLSDLDRGPAALARRFLLLCGLGPGLPPTSPNLPAAVIGAR
jgi:O-antigen/teichoic acid export membrane protein